MSRPAAPNALELAAALESQGRALIAHAARLRELAGERSFGNGAAAAGTDVWLSAYDVIQRTGLSRGQVYRLARQGGLGAVRCGSRSFRFSERGLAAWAQDGGAR